MLTFSLGSVVSESVDARASTDIYRGLHFPASDIPKQARELYMINTVRILYDRKQESARLVCRSFDDAKTPLNLSHSYLRSMSPIHLKYLANMVCLFPRSFYDISGARALGRSPSALQPLRILSKTDTNSFTRGSKRACQSP